MVAMGVAVAIEEGLIRAPRLFFAGKALSPTGGHGDVRGPGVEAYDTAYIQPGLGMIVDGVHVGRGGRLIGFLLQGFCVQITEDVDHREKHGRQRVGFPHGQLTPDALAHDIERIAG
jgi:hypothetical protein